MRVQLTLIKSEKGFTLVELMIVVAIIGLLSAVAIPNFKKYQAKSKTAEAKIQLAAIYTAMQSWYSEYDNYASCLYSMGYDPSREFRTRYFATGFEKGNYPINSASVNNGATGDCTDDTTSIDDAYEPPSPSAFGAGKQISGFNAGRDHFVSGV